MKYKFKASQTIYKIVEIEATNEDKAYEKAQEADRMKTSFLHYMTNQMTEPSDAIDKSVSELCNNYNSITLKEANREVDMIQKQSHTIIDVLNHMLYAADNDTGKEVAHE